MKWWKLNNTAVYQIQTKTDFPGFDGILKHDTALNGAHTPTASPLMSFPACHVLGLELEQVIYQENRTMGRESTPQILYSSFCAQ